MKILLILSAIFFIISIGSILRQRELNADAIINTSVSGRLFLMALPLASFILLIICVAKITTLRWFWNIPIAFVIHIVLWNFLTDIYSSSVGAKTKPQLSLFEGKMVRYNNYFIDAIITFGLGIIIFLFAN